MKMKKTISITIALLMCLLLLPASSFAATTPASSSYEDYANSLAPLGVFKGTGAGYELDRGPTRIEGLIMLVRLLGVEEEAMAMKGSKIPFTDVPKWANGYVAYAYSNNLTKGINKTKFGSTNNMEAKAFVTFLLRSLGYRDYSGDFSYTNALQYAKKINLLNDSTFANLNGATFLRAHVAKTSYDTLKFPIKNTDVPLINRLMAEDKINNKVGNVFIATVLTEPVSLIDTSNTQNPDKNIEIAKNTESMVMIDVYGDESDSQGSGVIVSSDGTIVTNYHVIAGANSIIINFNDGSKYLGAVYVQDYNIDLDLAILKINKTGLRAAVIGNSNNLKQGEAIVVIGSPYGLFNTVTEGIISAIRPNNIQISAAINPGNSGGGLFNRDGELIGIAYEKIEYADNLGFAIPINKLSMVAGKKMMSIAAFANSNPVNSMGKIDYPKNIHIVKETYDEIFINWDPVKNAEYYYVYYQTEGEDTFWYGEESGKQDKFYYDNNSSLSWSDLTHGERYNIIVTSVGNGIESEDSEIFSFVKSY